MPLFLVNNNLERLYGKPEEMPKDVRREYFRQQPLTVEALTDGVLDVAFYRDLTIAPYYCYKINNEDWQMESNSGVRHITVKKGDKVQFRGKISKCYGTSQIIFSIRSSNGHYKVYGNIMSLSVDFLYKDIDFDEFLNLFSLLNGAFSLLFFCFYGLKDAGDLILPKCLHDSQYIYQQMFGQCTSLTKAPELSATTLTEGCYYSMFEGCRALTTAPELPATTLADYCYYYMFNGCASLTTSPELPATTLTENCYKGMFRACIALTTAPELPATTLVTGCYAYMFHDCSHLNYIKAMFTTNPSLSFTGNWVNGVAATGTFVKAPKAKWDVIGTWGVPNGWTIEQQELTVQGWLWFDDFPNDYDEETGEGHNVWEDEPAIVYNSINNPDGMNCNYVVCYGDTLEIDGETYYIWEGEDNAIGALTFNGKILTTTMREEDLVEQSLEHNFYYYVDVDDVEERRIPQEQELVDNTPFTALYGFLINDEFYPENDEWVSEQRLVKYEHP